MQHADVFCSAVPYGEKWHWTGHVKIKFSKIIFNKGTRVQRRSWILIKFNESVKMPQFRGSRFIKYRGEGQRRGRDLVPHDFFFFRNVLAHRRIFFPQLRCGEFKGRICGNERDSPWLHEPFSLLYDKTSLWNYFVHTHAWQAFPNCLKHFLQWCEIFEIRIDPIFSDKRIRENLVIVGNDMHRTKQSYKMCYTDRFLFFFFQINNVIVTITFRSTAKRSKISKWILFGTRSTLSSRRELVFFVPPLVAAKFHWNLYFVPLYMVPLVATNVCVFTLVH